MFAKLTLIHKLRLHNHNKGVYGLGYVTSYGEETLMWYIIKYMSIDIERGIPGHGSCTSVVSFTMILEGASIMSAAPRRRLSTVGNS